MLLVEDNDLVRDFTKDHLSLLGYRILSADSGQSALDIIGERADIDLLFTDRNVDDDQETGTAQPEIPESRAPSCRASTWPQSCRQSR